MTYNLYLYQIFVQIVVWLHYLEVDNKKFRCKSFKYFQSTLDHSAKSVHRMLGKLWNIAPTRFSPHLSIQSCSLTENPKTYFSKEQNHPEQLITPNRMFMLGLWALPGRDFLERKWSYPVHLELDFQMSGLKSLKGELQCRKNENITFRIHRKKSNHLQCWE